ncbi:DAK2 domain-containing protein [Rhodococcus sp. CC-R104]|uniref:DAK2 domain-containing protein n=1 Tax=Rhodococcus chondri TaxID=3065941 RepID=A0ABU7K0U0_9NOCA|nr:DAK2 domain-containing protein [Rhodococcus sp. CC-R104]
MFPVPDGDTGTNLVITLRAAAAELGDPVDGALSAAEVFEALARGAFVGARGNSGVILAQALRGFADSVEGRAVLDGPGFARALHLAAELVTGALSSPAEGTIVSVLHAAAEGAAATAREIGALAPVAEAAAESAAVALQRTTGQLAVLAEAGVVDAGGLGLLILLDCFVEVVSGTRPDRTIELSRRPATLRTSSGRGSSTVSS